MLRRTLPLLVGLAAGLPVVICVLAGLARLMAGLGDTTGAIVIDRLALAAGAVWIVGLIFLVITQGIDAINRGRPPEE
ncbi:MAG: hypothetical protein AB7O62_04285 [Pirellulales bacterium]